MTHQRIGIELEMPVCLSTNGASHPVTDRFFKRLSHLKRGRGLQPRLQRASGRIITVQGEWGDSGLDNSFNLLESALPPIDGQHGGLDRLAAAIDKELRDVAAALRSETATVLNASQHPQCRLDLGWCRHVLAPRPIYRELICHRGWHNWWGMDAKAQNGCNTGVRTVDAARALNVVLGLAPALIALYANSPLECGRATGLKETRLTMWPRQFRHARFQGDFLLQQMPPRPFRDLGDYFRWIFQPGTATRSLPLKHGGNYKHAASILLDGDPDLPRFLRARQWPGKRSDTGARVMLRPDTRHFVHSQIAHFMDARWRYQLASHPPLEELLEAWEQEGGLEQLFEAHGVEGYIEGRAPGACFPDLQLNDEAGPDIAATATVSASALQAGLLHNLDAAQALVHRWGWDTLRELRPRAVRHALSDDHVYRLAQETLETAADGLDATSQRWLAYPLFMISTRHTAADRMLSLWQQYAGDPRRMQHIAHWRGLYLG